MKPDYPDIDIAPFIDHALLTPAVMPEQVEHGVRRQTDFSLVCVYPAYVLQLNFRRQTEDLYGDWLSFWSDNISSEAV